jgi:hypothetical protein
MLGSCSVSCVSRESLCLLLLHASYKIDGRKCSCHLGLAEPDKDQ